MYRPNVCWPYRMMPHGESQWVCRRDRRTDGRTPDHCITLSDTDAASVMTLYVYCLILFRHLALNVCSILDSPAASGRVRSPSEILRHILQLLFYAKLCFYSNKCNAGYDGARQTSFKMDIPWHILSCLSIQVGLRRITLEILCKTCRYLWNYGGIVQNAEHNPIFLTN